MHYLELELNERVQQDPAIFNFLQEGSLDGLWYWDLEDQNHEWMSDEFWKLFGVEPGSRPHATSSWQDMINPEDLEVAIANFKAHLDDPSHPYDQIVRYTHQVTGRTITVRCRGVAIRDQDGKPLRMLGAHTDLTELAEKETQLREAMRMRETFMRGLNHEIRTPMNGIIGLTQVLKRRHTDASDQKMLNAIESSANDLLGLMTGLLNLAQISSNAFDMDRSLIKPAVVAENTATLFLSDSKRKGLTLVLDLDGAHQPMMLSERVVRHVLQNLISNAVKFTETGSVNVALTTKSGALEITVWDTGPGLSESETQTIFDEMKRGSQAHGKPGWGVGLALAKQLCDLHGGHIEALPHEGGGALFRALLPQLPRPGTDQSSRLKGVGSSRVPHILLADDVPTNQMVIEAMLVDQGFLTTVASSGRQALELLQSKDFDGALLDIEMPDLRGPDIVKLYMQDVALGKRPALPFASHSAHTDPIQVASYRAAGFGFHVPKPVRFEDIENLKSWILSYPEVL